MLVTLKKLSQNTGLSVSCLRNYKRDYLIEGKHFFKKRGIIFVDESAFFDWIKGDNGKRVQQEGEDMGKLISKWQTNTKANRISLQ